MELLGIHPMPEHRSSKATGQGEVQLDDGRPCHSHLH